MDQEKSSIADLKNALNQKEQELEKVKSAFKKMRDEWEIRLQYSRRGLEVKNRQIAITNSKLSKTNKELKELKNSLEDKVQERTEELQKRVNELEKWRIITVGRELRMKELKKETKELKEKLKEKQK